MAKRRKREEPPIRVAHNEISNVREAGPPYGSVLTFQLKCGACGYWFERYYHLAQLAQGYPHEACPKCERVNYVPYTLSGRSGK